MSKVAIITARGGSKRIPRKNIKEFCGRPIIAYSIKAALESDLFDEVMVSTDDEEIADVSRAYGASVPFMRSASASDDYATTTDALLEVLCEYARRGRVFDTLCCLYPAAPFVNPDELCAAMRMIDMGATSVIPVISFDFPPLRGFRFDENGRLQYAFPEYALSRSQDLPDMVHDCGRFYFATVEAFEKSQGFVTERTKAIYIESKLVQDIDVLEDWELAEQKFLTMIRGSENEIA